MAKLDPGGDDGYLIGVTDDRVRSLRFTTTKGAVRVPVTHQAFVLWTTDAFRDLKRYDALGDGNRVLAANFNATRAAAPRAIGTRRCRTVLAGGSSLAPGIMRSCE